MNPVPRVRTLALLPLVFAILPPQVQGQDPCPSASGDEAEAGWTAYVANDMSEARRRFQEALARCENDQYARTGLAYVYLRDGDTTEAERLWTVVVSADADNVDALVGLGLAAWRLGDLEAVRRYFTRIVEVEPGHPTAVEYLERVAAAERSEVGVNDPADEAWRDGNTARAMRLYSDRLAANPEDGTAMLRVALMQAWRGEYDAARELLDRLVELEPGDLDTRLARARVRAWSGDIPAALDEVREVLALQPDSREAVEALALFQAWAGQFDEALASYDELLSITPGSNSARLQQARALAWAARFEVSRAAYDSLLARDPDDIEARLGLARTLAYTRNYEGAIEQYDRVLSQAPGDTRTLTAKSRTLGWAGRLVESEQVALEAVEADRSSAEAWGGLGQVYRWQGRHAAAKDALETAAALEPMNAEVRDQLRSVRLNLAALARPTVIIEDDSDGNRMVTTLLTASWHPTPRFDVRADGYYKQLEQTFALGVLERTAQGATVTGTYQLSPGWTLSAGLGGSTTDAPGDPTFLEYRASIRTPDRHRMVTEINVSSGALSETAALAERRVESTSVLMTGRWNPTPGWRVDGNIGWSLFQGSEDNERRSAFLSASRRLGRFFSLGASFRGFSFEKNVNDGYFDPDFYGIAEIASYWLYRPAAWTFLVEFAPGIQQVTTDGDPESSIRTNARVSYRVSPGRELSLSFGYSSAGLTTFATGAEGYRYTAVIFGVNWVF
jgi:tetratricopeptide (TPR) repeat protein